MSPGRPAIAEPTALVHVSAIGANPYSKSVYARTKAEAEAAVLAAFPAAAILRPSIVFGPEDQFFNRFAALARIAPVLPLIGGGRTRFEPVYAGDVAAAIANAVEGQARPGTTYELGGPQTFAFRELMQLTLAYSGRRRCLLPVPFFLAKLQAVLTKPLPAALRPLTVDQVRMLADRQCCQLMRRGSKGGRWRISASTLPKVIERHRAGLPRALQAPRPVRALSRLDRGSNSRFRLSCSRAINPLLTPCAYAPRRERVWTIEPWRRTCTISPSSAAASMAAG